MDIGNTLTWRESVFVKNNNKYVKIGERNVTGIIVKNERLRTGGKTIKVYVISVDGCGPVIVGTQIWRKHVKVTRGLSWYLATVKPKKPERGR